ncbi:MAG TPA: DUF805 domain-containing protein [Stellaceae bacterium]|jgi:uncharacterized membrane protein YhaH (DUF805 family)|nr:DUF805 domain-containing protein [Stellaceae bacterium]
MEFFLSAQGRIPRYQWWLGSIGLGVAGLIVGVIIGLVFGAAARGFAGRAVLFLVSLAIIYGSYCLIAKRFHDRDKPELYAQLVVGFRLVKIVLDLIGVSGNHLQLNGIDYIFLIGLFGIAIWLFIDLGCLRGTIGPNQYGPDPLAGR